MISFIFERKRILSAIEDNDGIKRPFENERDIKARIYNYYFLFKRA